MGFECLKKEKQISREISSAVVIGAVLIILYDNRICLVIQSVFNQVKDKKEIRLKV